jgi:hypothetical protein
VGFGVNQSRSAQTYPQRLVVHDLFKKASGCRDHVLRPRHLAANLSADQVSVEVEAANFDCALCDQNAHDVPPLRIEFQRNSGPTAAGRLCAAFTEQPLIQQAADYIAHAIRSLSRLPVKLPAT